MKPMRAALGIDVGGTNAKVGILSASGRILREVEVPTEPGLGPRRFVERLGRLLDSWRQEEPRLKISGVGLGLAGDVDSERGMLRFAPNLKGWDGYDFKKAFRERLHCHVVVDNDANLAVWGGYVLELKKKPRNVLGVTLGTGVGGGLILGGKLYRGATGSAGEIGHTRVETPGELCHCGLRGCLEAYVGSYGLVRMAKKFMAQSRTQSMLAAIKDLEPAHIALAAQRGDSVAREVWKSAGRYLGLGLSNLVLVLNPEVIILLGGISRAGKWLLSPIREQWRQQPFRTPFKHLSLRVAGNHNGGFVGAALLAMENSSGR